MDNTADMNIINQSINQECLKNDLNTSHEIASNQCTEQSNVQSEKNIDPKLEHWSQQNAIKNAKNNKNVPAIYSPPASVSPTGIVNLTVWLQKRTNEASKEVKVITIIILYSLQNEAQNRENKTKSDDDFHCPRSMPLKSVITRCHPSVSTLSFR